MSERLTSGVFVELSCWLCRCRSFRQPRLDDGCCVRRQSNREEKVVSVVRHVENESVLLWQIARKGRGSWVHAYTDCPAAWSLVMHSILTRDPAAIVAQKNVEFFN